MICRVCVLVQIVQVAVDTLSELVADIDCIGTHPKILASTCKHLKMGASISGRAEEVAVVQEGHWVGPERYPSCHQ